MELQKNKDVLRAGTGFMLSLTEAVQSVKDKGYAENLVPKFDHFECQSGKYKIYASDFEVDEVIRIENTSDPDDQSVLYAISAPQHNLKGIYTDSYGLYHDDLSSGILEKLKVHL